ncbi:MAG: nucleotidyltransferase family protein [Elusimicrobiota bacterium]
MTGARVLLLAAGRGRRAGGPKAWRPHGDTTLLESHLSFFEGLLGPGTLSIAIQDEWRSRCAVLSPKTVWVAADPDASPLSSLQALIAAFPAVRSFVLHVDMPVFDRTVYEALSKAPGDAVVPTREGRRGHPVLLSPSVLAEISRLDAKTDRLDAFLRMKTVVEVPVATGAIDLNMNEAP